MSAKQIVILVLVVALGSVAADYKKLLPYRWQTYASPDGKFSLSFPGQFAADEDTRIPNASGGNTILHTITSSPTDSASYSFSYCENPGMAAKDTQKVLNANRDGAVKSVQGTLVSERDFSVQGHPAKEFDARTKANAWFSSLVILDAERIYILAAVDTARVSPDKKNVQRFFDSLRLASH